MAWSFVLFAVIALLFFLFSGSKVKSVGSHFQNTTNQPYSFFTRISKALILFLALGSAFLLNGNKALGQCPTNTPPFPVGSSTWTVPAGVTSITVEAWGAGGGGASRSSNGRGAGGGGGAYSRSIFSVTPGNDLWINVGAGGASTIDGGDSWVSTTATVANAIILSNGGLGAPDNGTANVRGGTIAGPGTIKYFGGDGGAIVGGDSGGGGSSAGTAANGTTGGAPNGGIAPAGGGNGGAGSSNNNIPGQPGTSPGGGGGGARRGAGATTTIAGGAGANGLIRISYTLPANTSTSASPNRTLCIGTALSASAGGNITHITSGAIGIGTPIGLPPGVVAAWSGDIITISGTPTSAAGSPYNYSIPMSGGCITGQSAVTGTITVSANNTTGTISSNTFCQGTALPSGVTQATTGATGIGAPINLPPGVNATWASNAITFFGTPTTAGTFTYSIPLTGGCGTVNATGTITINPNNTVGAASSSPIVCINPVVPITVTHTTTGATGIGAASGLPTGVTASWASNTITISGIPNESGTFNYNIPLPGCGGVIATGTITVTPNNTVTPASTTPQVCINPVVPITINHTTTGATGIGAIAWSPSNPGGMSASFTGNTISVSGTPTNSGVFTYSIPLTGGCGTVNATGTITVNAVPITIHSPSFATNQSRCINASPGFNALSVESRTGFSYQWYRNTSGTIDTAVDTEVGTNTNSYTPLNDGTVPQTSRYYVVVTSSSTSCGSAATSALSGVFTVNPLPFVSFTDQPSSPTCVDTDVTYSTQASETNYVWTIPGVLGTDYSISSMSGATLATSNSITLQYKTAGNKSIQVNYTDAQSCGATSPATSNSITVQKNTATPPSTYPSVCLNGTIIPFTHTTTLATGIGAPTGLPDGLTAGFSGNTITISGTITGAPGLYPYTIPLTGGCGIVVASGTLEISPVYTLSTITSVSPSATGGNATVRITGDPTILLNGTYEVTYSMGLANTSGPTTTTVVITNGKGLFSTSTIGNEDLTSLTISQIKKDTDACFIPITSNNITFFGIRSAVYTENGTFYVPAGIYQITIKVWGGGGGGGKASNGAGGGGGGYTQVTIPVTPGEPIGMYIGSSGNGETNSPATAGGNSYATRDPAFPSSLAFANGGSAASGGTLGNGGTGQTNNGQNGSPATVSAGGKGGNGGGSNGGTGGPGGTGTGNNPGGAGTAPGGGGGGSDGNSNGGNGGQGLILISYPLPPVGPCFKVIDDGSKSRISIIEFTCDDTWIAPEGLAEFTVYVGSAGGGGGSGEGSGGGGSGAIISQTFTTTNPYGLPAGSSFPLTVGDGGNGATGINSSGVTGEVSSFTGIIDGSTINIVVPGGGGGGSQSSQPGETGASGGGGGASRDNPLTPQSSGAGGSPIAITYSGPNIFVYQGNEGGNGDAVDVPSKDAAIAGGGGGGLIPWKLPPANDGQNGKAAGLGQGEGGRGGDAMTLTLGDSIRYYGAGGGGIGEYFNGTEKIGEGGTANGITIGGDGNLDINNTDGVGYPGMDKTGSGGGAGYNGGGRGGNGIVYIYYENFRILPVEFISFDAKLDQANRTSDLTWATAKEWESSHFEIERSVNGVSKWNKIGELESQGYSEVPTEYSFSDSKLPASGGIVYYRLKQVDFNGKFSYSNTKSIKVEALKGSGAWIAYPNPSSKKNVVTLDLINSSVYSDEPILIRISDIKGVSETYTVNQIESVSEVVNAYLDRSISGVYILQLVWGNNSQQLKLLRQ